MFNYDPTANAPGPCTPFLYGCTDPAQFNYDPLANTDNGSCIPFTYGCTDILACNYNLLANTDDESCNYNSSSYDTLISNISIVWNGMTLIASGDYSVILANVIGCDSIANLSFSIINTTGVENVFGHNKVLIKITDILGKETPYRRNIPLFYIYNDGTVERKLIIK